MNANILIHTAQERIRKHPRFIQRLISPLDAASVTPVTEPRMSVEGIQPSFVLWNDVHARLSNIIQKEISAHTSSAVHVVHSSGVISLSIPENTTARIRIQQLLTAGAWTSVLITAREGSTVMIESSSPFISGVSYGSTMVLFDIHKNASVTWNGLIEGCNGPHTVARIAHVADGGMLNHTECLMGCTSVRDYISTYLVGGRSQVSARRACIGKKNEQYDLGMEAVHIAPNTVSDLQSKGVLGGRSRSLCSGMVRMERQASGAAGIQSMETLLLSSESEADVVPSMEVEIDDVKCTHRATVSRVRDDDLFYLQSRGMPRKTATQLIAEGFVKDVIPESIAHAVSDAVEEAA